MGLPFEPTNKEATMYCDKKGFISILRGGEAEKEPEPEGWKPLPEYNREEPAPEIDWAARLREMFAPFLECGPPVCERPAWDCVECGMPTESVVCPNCQHI